MNSDDGLSQEMRVARAVVLHARGGLHARLAARIARAVRESGIAARIGYAGAWADANSVVALLELGASENDILTLEAQGSHAGELVDILARWVKDSELSAKGNGLAPGRRTGQARFVRSRTLVADENRRPVDAVDPAIEVELARLHDAFNAARSTVEAQQCTLAPDGLAVALLAVQQELLGRSDWMAAAERQVRSGSVTAEAAIQGAVHAQWLLVGQSEPLREAWLDVGDLLLRYLAYEGPDHSVHEIPIDDVVLVGERLLLSDLLRQDMGHVVGALVADAGPFSHLALLARELGLPLVAGLSPEWLRTILPGTWLSLDGTQGTVCLEEFDAQITLSANDSEVELCEAVQPPPGQACAHLWVAGDTPAAIEAGLASGAGGIGLVRSDWQFLGRTSPPDEAEQERVYRALASAAAGRPLVVRTFDLGAAKTPIYLDSLCAGSRGRRGLAAALACRDLFAVQLRTLLRMQHTYEGALRVLFPMVASLDDWRQAHELWARVRHELEGEEPVAGGEPGAMLETPGILWALDTLLAEVAFVSLGTSDLLATLYGLDREVIAAEPGRAYMLDPALWRLLQVVLMGGRQVGVPVYACGYLAQSLPTAWLLWGLGVTALCISPERLQTLALLLTPDDRARAAATAREVLSCHTSTQVEDLLRDARAPGEWSISARG